MGLTVEVINMFKMDVDYCCMCYVQIWVGEGGYSFGYSFEGGGKTPPPLGPKKPCMYTEVCSDTCTYTVINMKLCFILINACACDTNVHVGISFVWPCTCTGGFPTHWPN